LEKYEMHFQTEDRITIKNLKVKVSIGITATERSQPQEVSITLELVPQTSLSALEDQISRTVDYFSVYKRVIDLAQSRERCLIETLADDIGEALLKEFDLSQVAIEIRKFILPGTDFVSVRLVKQG